MIDVLQSDADRALGALLTSVLDGVQEQLTRTVWNGFVIAEPDAPHVSRARLVHVARLRVKATKREYNVSAHLFESFGVETAPHDHRYPLAVFPFAIDARAGGPLYEMQWINTRTQATSRVVVNAGDVWAIAEPLSVRHTVRTLSPHASIILSDVTEPATRDDRMTTSTLPPQEITRVRERVLAALQAHRIAAERVGLDLVTHDCGGADVDD